MFKRGEKNMEINTDMILTLLTIFSGATAVISFINVRKKENRKEGAADAQLKADIQYIKSVITDIRTETREINSTLDSHSERLTRVEESAKQAHKRIDEHEAQLNELKRGN